MSYKVLAINPGSTSTKAAVFDGDECLLVRIIRHSPDELGRFQSSSSQFEYRCGAVVKTIEDAGIALDTMDAFVGRGGILKPLKAEPMRSGRKCSMTSRHPSMAIMQATLEQ